MGTILAWDDGKCPKGTVDDWDGLPLFLPAGGQNYHRSNVRAHLLAFVDYDYRCLYISHQSWPFNIITKCETIPVSHQIRTYQPRSDLLISKSKSSLPRLLIEVNSKPQKGWPEDLIQMLLRGATIVRFANTFLDVFKEKKDFVFFAIYVWDNGKVTHCFKSWKSQRYVRLCIYKL